MLGIFDSGFGGLTILREIHGQLPELDTLYLGDNARAPYGSRDHNTIFRWTLEGIRFLFAADCPLIVVACNTASAQALRRIQQEILPREFPDRRVLGVIRPSAEAIVRTTVTGRIGIIGTRATTSSGAYTRECRNLDPGIRVVEVACPELVPLIESGITDGASVRHAIQTAATTMLARGADVDTLLLGCTHYPLSSSVFREMLPASVRVVEQGPIVADRLRDYLGRHPEIVARLGLTGGRHYRTTDDDERVSQLASRFYRAPVQFNHFSPTSTALSPLSLPTTTGRVS